MGLCEQWGSLNLLGKRNLLIIPVHDCDNIVVLTCKSAENRRDQSLLSVYKEVALLLPGMRTNMRTRPTICKLQGCIAPDRHQDA